jgi:hypothetical protein
VIWRELDISIKHITSIFGIEEEAKQETSRCRFGLLFSPEEEGDKFLQTSDYFHTTCHKTVIFRKIISYNFKNFKGAAILDCQESKHK